MRWRLGMGCVGWVLDDSGMSLGPHGLRKVGNSIGWLDGKVGNRVGNRAGGAITLFLDTPDFAIINGSTEKIKDSTSRIRPSEKVYSTMVVWHQGATTVVPCLPRNPYPFDCS